MEPMESVDFAQCFQASLVSHRVTADGCLEPLTLPFELGPLEEQGFLATIDSAGGKDGPWPPAAVSGHMETPLSASFTASLTHGRTAMVSGLLRWVIPPRATTQLSVTMRLLSTGRDSGQCNASIHGTSHGTSRGTSHGGGSEGALPQNRPGGVPGEGSRGRPGKGSEILRGQSFVVQVRETHSGAAS